MVNNNIIKYSSFHRYPVLDIIWPILTELHFLPQNFKLCPNFQDSINECKHWMDTWENEYQKTELNLRWMIFFLGQHYNVEPWMMNFWGNINCLEWRREKRKKNKEIFLARVLYYIMLNQTKAFLIWFLIGISFTIKKFMRFGKCSVQNKIMLGIAMTVKKSLKNSLNVK